MSMNDVRRQQSQKPRLPRKIQHESQRKFNRHIKLFYSITHQEPVSVLPQSCLILTCQSNLQNTCLLILFFFSIYIYIYIWLHQVLDSASGIFSCRVLDLVP